MRPDSIRMGSRLNARLGAGSCVLALLLATGCEHAAHPPARKLATVSCPQSEMVPAYSNHRSYPQWDPTRPPAAARIVRCFASMSLASAGGYPPWAPRGALIVDGVLPRAHGGWRARPVSCSRPEARLPGALPRRRVGDDVTGAELQ